MEAFVINLDSRPDRWLMMKKRFPNFKLTRIPAVVKSVPAYGNFLSMIKAIKLAKKRGLDEILILEDDCLPVKGFLNRWASIKEWLDLNPDKWDVYSGGAHKIILPSLIGEHKSIKFYDPVWSVAAHWIYVEKRSYNKLLAHYSRYCSGTQVVPMLGVDVHNNFFKTVISYPFIAYQDSGFSDIKKQKRDTRKIFRNAERGLK